MMKDMYAALNMRTCSERVIMGLGATLPNHIPASMSEFLYEKNGKNYLIGEGGGHKKFPISI